MCGWLPSRPCPRQIVSQGCVQAAPLVTHDHSQVWLVAQDFQDPPLRQAAATGVNFSVPDLTPPTLEAALVLGSSEAYA